MAQFFSISDKATLIQKLEKGDAVAIKTIINELDRLESIIKNYELAFEQTKRSFEKEKNNEPKIHI